MEDEAGKTRRNLMTFTTVLLAIAWLKIPLEGKPFGLPEMANIEPWRAWAAALVILLYLALRYHHEPSTQEAREKWRLSLAGHVYQGVKAFVEDAVRAKASGKARRGITVEFKQMPTELIPAIDIFVSVMAQNLAALPISMMSSGNINLRTNDVRLQRTFDPSPMPYRLSRIRFASLVCTGILRAFAPTWVTLEAVIPYLLTAAAALVALSRLISAAIN